MVLFQSINFWDDVPEVEPNIAILIFFFNFDLKDKHFSTYTILQLKYHFSEVIDSRPSLKFKFKIRFLKIALESRWKSLKNHTYKKYTLEFVSEKKIKNISSLN